MSKADTLLKRAAAFEKLALYSDRKSFLQALAQNPPARIQQIPPGGGFKYWIDPVSGDAFDSETGGNPVDPKTGRPFRAGPVQPDIPQVSMGPDGAYSDPYNPNTGVRRSQEEGGMAPTPAGASPDRDPTLLMSKQLNAPAVPEKAAPAKPARSYDEDTVKLLQTFLASSLGLDMSFIDGKFGQKTLDALKQWARANKVPASSVDELVNVALKQSGYR